MAALQATLTLPGIAGIVLTLGMSVDANVLVNERMREELRAGKSPREAVEEARLVAGEEAVCRRSSLLLLGTTVGPTAWTGSCLACHVARRSPHWIRRLVGFGNYRRPCGMA